MSRKYAVVTAVSTFRMRYVIPVDELRQMNPTFESFDDKTALDWAMDTVTCEDAVDFSQTHLGELILDTDIMTQEQVLELFDKDNAYLKDWSTEKKLNHINNWKDSWKEKNSKSESEAK